MAAKRFSTRSSPAATCSILVAVAVRLFGRVPKMSLLLLVARSGGSSRAHNALAWRTKAASWMVALGLDVQPAPVITTAAIRAIGSALMAAYDATVNLERPAIIRALLAAASVMLVIGLIGVFTVDSKDTNLATSTGDTTTSTSATGDVTTAPVDTTAVTAQTATTKAGAKGTATTKASAGGPPPTSSANVPDPGPTKPPSPGTYTYRASDNSEYTDKIEAEPDSNGAAHRKETAPAFGGSVTNEEVWTASSVTIPSSVIVNPAAPNQAINCAWQPPILLLQLPLAANKTWSSDSTC